MRKFAATLLAIALSSQAQAQVSEIEVSALSVTRDGRGGCEIIFEVTNDFEWTMEFSGDAYIRDLEGTTLGDAFVNFPPAMPSKKARAKATFHPTSLAAGSCPQYFDFSFAMKYCEVVDTSDYLKDRYCRATWDFAFKPTAD